MTSLTSLSTVCNEMDQWPRPVPGLTLNLPVMGVVFQVGRSSQVWGEELPFHLFVF